MDRMKIPIADDEFLPNLNSRCLEPAFNFPPEKFDWVKADVADARFVTDRNIKNAKGEGQIAWLIEPFFLHPENYMEALQKPFDFVLTHNQYFCQNRKNWLWCPLGGTLIHPEDRRSYPKTKDISLLLTGKKSMRGHQLRYEVAERFGSRCDIFVPAPGNYIPKLEVLRDYRFSIIIENERCPGFFTEKIIDCFLTATIPIYWGCPDIRLYFKNGSILSFETLDDLEIILNHLHPYESFWGGDLVENFNRSGQYTKIEDWLYDHYPFLFSSEEIKDGTLG